MKRKLIGVAKVYLSSKAGVDTYETVWPRKLYNLTHGQAPHDDRRKARTVSSVVKMSHAHQLLLCQTERKP